MKKILAGILSAAAVLSLQMPAFAIDQGARTYQITNITGNPLNEDGEQFSIGDTAQPGQTVYFTLPVTLADWADSSKDVRISTRKEKNSKLIKSIKVVEKKLTNSSKNTIYVPNQQNPTSNDYAQFYTNQRNSYIALELSEMTGVDEQKIEFSVTFTARKPAVLCYGKRTDTKNDAVTENGVTRYTQFFNGKSGDKLTLTGTLYVGNQEEDGDSASVTVGNRGVTIRPEKNVTNEVVFEGSDTYATLTYKANSNPSKFYAAMSTKWPSSLSSKFRNTDAVIRKFTAAAIPASGRATLALNNPFDSGTDPDDVYIYTADSKGKLRDITRTVTYNEDDDTFELQTRTLTTYILSNERVSTK